MAQPAMAGDDDDTICQVCFEGWTEPSNQMLYCDRCNIAVHQGCYGIAAIPDGDWFCAPCDRDVQPLETKCLLCPFYGGALRPVVDEWIHVSCVMWLPEIGYGDTEMLSVSNLNKVNPQRFGLRCSICDAKHGACVQCNVKDCYTAMHVICAHSQALLRMQTSENDDVQMKQFCRKHAPPLPLEFSQTPEAERARAFAVMKHAKDSGTSTRGALQEPNPDEILQTLVRLHLKQTQSEQQTESEQSGSKRRRKGGDIAASRSDRPRPAAAAAAAAAPPVAPARKRTLSSYSSGAPDDEEGSESGDERDDGGSDTDRFLRSFGDERLDDFVKPGRPRNVGTIPQSDAQDDDFWTTVEPYFVPFSADQATRMLFGGNSAPASAIDSYLQRLSRGRQAATAFMADPSTGRLTDAVCGATVSATIDVVDESHSVQISCPMCAQIPQDTNTSSGELCSACSASMVKVSMQVNQKSAECVFRVAPTGPASDDTQGLSQPAVQCDQRAALNEMLNLCLQIDRRSLENREAAGAAAASAATAAACSTSVEVMSSLASKAAAVITSMRQSHDTHEEQVTSILRAFSWDGAAFARPLDMWDLTKLTSQLARFCISIFAVSASLPESVSASASASSPEPSQKRLRPSIQTHSYRMTEEPNPNGSMSEIELEAAALSVELAERCRANSAMAFSTWEKIDGARSELGSGPQVAALGGTKPDSVAVADDYCKLQELEARTNETYRIRMNWHQIRNSVFRGLQDVDLERRSKGEDEDDSVCCICFDADSTEVNPIVFCEGCNIAVHKFCYGLPQVPEEDWFCKKCESTVHNADVLCQFCGIGDGALKRTSDGDWAHSFCSIWHSDVSLRDATTTPIIRVPPKPRKKQAYAAVEDNSAAGSGRCTVCGETKGPVKHCAHPGCSRKYHVMCAWYDGLLCHVYDSAKLQYEVEMDVYCDEHVPNTVKRVAAAQKKWRNKDRADNSTKKRRGKKMSTEEKARQQRVRARSSVPDKYPKKTCAVCFSANPELGNVIIQCVGCKLYCHQACYGVTELPNKKTWQCRVCESGVEQVECVLCPRTGGLFKPTTTGGWAHLTCALWIPESHVKNAITMEPVVPKLTKQRQNLRCVLCGVRAGGCIQCAEKCYTAFHPLCAFVAGHYMRMDERQGDIQFKAYCKRHTDDMASEVARQAALIMPPEFLKLQGMRRDFERLRILTGLVQKREIAKRDGTRSRLQIMRHSFVGGMWPPGAEAPDAGQLANDEVSDGESDDEEKKKKKGGKRASGGR